MMCEVKVTVASDPSQLSRQFLASDFVAAWQREIATDHGVLLNFAAASQRPFFRCEGLRCLTCCCSVNGGAFMVRSGLFYRCCLAEADHLCFPEEILNPRQCIRNECHDTAFMFWGILRQAQELAEKADFLARPEPANSPVGQGAFAHYVVD
jgi:hypothetical protein